MVFSVQITVNDPRIVIQIFRNCGKLRDQTFLISEKDGLRYKYCTLDKLLYKLGLLAPNHAT